jgi:putative FmdB family regulatory protein
MPTYEFRCPIGHEFEKFYRSIGKAEAEVACPECGQIAERMMSAGAGLVFKGSGFYLTDYGKNAHLKKNPADAKSEGGGDGAKADGAKGEGAKGDGARSEGSKPESGSGGGAGGGESSSASGGSKSEGKAESKADAKPKAESKPAPAPPKKSTGE